LSFDKGHVTLFQVFTWFGATIEMDGATETDYTADEVSHCSNPIECFLSKLLVRKKEKYNTT